MALLNGGAVRRTGALVLGSALLAGSVLGAGAAYAAAPTGPTAKIGGWSKHVELKPGGASRTFTITVRNRTDHTLKGVDIGYSTYAAERPVLKEYAHGMWKTVPWGRTYQRNAGAPSFAAFASGRTLKRGATVTYTVRVSLPRHWDKSVSSVQAQAGARGEGWSDFRSVDFRVAR